MFDLDFQPVCSPHASWSPNPGENTAAARQQFVAPFVMCVVQQDLAHADGEIVKDGASAGDRSDLLKAHGHQGQRVRLLVFLVLKIKINGRPENTHTGPKAETKRMKEGVA